MRLVRVLAAIAAALLVPAPATHAETLTFEAGCNSEGPRVRIAAVGDLLFHDALQQQALAPGGDYKRFWAPVQPILSAADIVYGNLEGPAAEGVAAGGGAVKNPGRVLDRRVYGMTPGYLVFNYHPSLIADLKQSRFSVVSTANNHAADRGSLGIDRTIDALQAHGIAHTGTRRRGDAGPSGSAPPWSATTRAKDIAVAWLACTYSTNGIPDRHAQVLHCYAQRDVVMDELRRLRADPAIDAVVLTPHWGHENAHQPLPADRAYAREAIDAGADLVLGAHPHVLQPWEKRRAADGRDGLIVYSLGNFISNQPSPAQRSSVIALIDLVKPAAGGKARVAAAGFVPTWVERGRHRVTELTGEPRKSTPLALTLKLLPKGNRVTSRRLAKLPQACPPLAATAVVLPSGPADTR